MQKIKCSRWSERPGRPAARAFFDSSPVTFSARSAENIILEKRTQTLPVFIDDREKTNPKRTQINPILTPVKSH
jgi:hypothetical protein